MSFRNGAGQRARRILHAGFIAAIILIAGIAAFSVAALHRTSHALKALVTDEQASIEARFEMLQLARERSLVLFRLVNSHDAFAQDEQLMRFHALGGEFAAARERLIARDKNMDEGDRAMLEQQQQHTRETVAWQNKVLELLGAGLREQAMHLLVEKAIPAQDETLDTLNVMIQHEVLESQQEVQRLQDLHERLSWILAVAGLAAVFLIGVIFRHTRRRLDGLTGEIYGVAEDLKQANRKLAQQKFAMDQHDIVSIADVHGVITYANDKFCQVSQYGRDELIGHNHRLLKSGVHPDSLYEGMWRAISSGRIWQGEICNRKKDGSFYWVATTIVPFLDDAGLPYEYVSIRTEITAIKQAQAILSRNRDELESLVHARTLDLAEREALLSSITRSAQDAVVMVEPGGRVTYWNPAAEKIFGYSAEEIMAGEPCGLLVPDQYLGTLKTAFAQFRDTGNGALIGKTVELTALRKGGAEFPIEISFSGVQLGERWHAVGIARDISARKLAERQLEQMAATDPLTGACNRRRFGEVLHAEVTRSRRYGEPLSLIMVDIDHFKRINDSYGHPAGDAVLVKFANLISGSIRETDIFARMGGEEFAILALSCDLGCARKFAEKLRRLVEAHVFPEVGRITCSFGVAAYTDKNMEETNLIKQADEALYEAKGNGRNCVVVAGAAAVQTADEAAVQT